MLRQIALDTETTGKDDETITGEHRIIEIGCVEIIDRKITGREYRVLLNPMRSIDEEATAVHGITNQMLEDKPLFKDIASDFIDFITGSELLIHNAKFDCAFLNKELLLIGDTHGIDKYCKVLDTLELARKINPNNQANLDNLCRIYDVDRSARTKHGALLDAQLLAEVYLAMTGGQEALFFGESEHTKKYINWVRPNGAKLPVMGISSQIEAVHKYNILSLSQGKKFKEISENNFISGSNWSNEYDMEYLEKGKDEGKKDYAKRLGAQKEQMLDKILTKDQQTELKEYLDADKKAHEEWVNRVNNGN